MAANGKDWSDEEDVLMPGVQAAMGEYLPTLATPVFGFNDLTKLLECHFEMTWRLNFKVTNLMEPLHDILQFIICNVISYTGMVNFTRDVTVKGDIDMEVEATVSGVDISELNSTSVKINAPQVIAGIKCFEQSVEGMFCERVCLVY